MNRKQTIQFQVIGRVESPHTQQEGTPIQSRYAAECEGTIELLPEFAAGLKDLEGFDRVWVIFFTDRAGQGALEVVPYRDRVKRGVFATRSPSRPNRICISCVALVGIEGNRVHIRGVDMLDGTPVLDLKPYVPEFDSYPDCRTGWLEDSDVRSRRADCRFSQDDKQDAEE